MLNGLRQKPDEMVNSTKAPPWSLAECSKDRPSSISTTRAPAPQSDAHSSWSVTDLPDPDLPTTATWPALSNGSARRNGDWSFHTRISSPQSIYWTWFQRAPPANPKRGFSSTEKPFAGRRFEDGRGEGRKRVG